MKSVIALALSLVSVSAIAAPKFEAGTYAVDAAHSKVGFEISHLVISTVEGRFDTVTGEIVMGKKFDDTKITASIDVASVSTGNADRDKHLKSPDFFDAAQFPKITFVSDSVSGPADRLTIKGEITIRGVTKPITLGGKYTGSVVDPYGNTKIAFYGKGTLSRKSFGLVWNKLVEAGPVVGDEVTIDLRIEAGKPAVKK
jgi:polyisoprenoid-binding protein YceI